MESKKNDKANLEKQRFLFMEIGLVISIGLVLIVFQYSDDKIMEDYLSASTPIIEQDMAAISLKMEPIRIETKRIDIPQNEKRIKIIENVNIEKQKIETFSHSLLSRPNLNKMLVENTDTNEVLFHTDEMPNFGGKGINGFREYIQRNFNYPINLAEKGIKGTIIVQFIVNNKGEVRDIKIIKGLQSELDNEAVRIISLSPVWIPGKLNGKAVNMIFNFPIILRN